jgi:hypothetical protein
LNLRILDWFRKEEVFGSKVLVCGLGNRFEELVSSDRAIYERFYRSTKALFPTILDLTEAIRRQQHDIIHLFCDVPPTGIIADNVGNTFAGTELIQECCDANVKLLWIASDNRPEGYIKNFGARGKRINLVMTIVRNDPKFSDFLDKLLFRMSHGDTMPVAWADLVPQVPSLVSADSPGCIFFAGRGGVRLR